GPVASVALYTKRPMSEVRSISLDSSSKTSVALTRVLCAKLFRIQPALAVRGPDLESMLEQSDAALIIGDSALLIDSQRASRTANTIEKIDLGEAWTRMTGLPFVYAFWAGRAEALNGGDIETLQQAGRAGIQRFEEIAREYFEDPALQATGAQYLRDNIKYDFGEAEQAGLTLFYRYASELGVLTDISGLLFYR